jgi:hypothetical protein
MGHVDDVEPVDGRKVARVAGVERKVVGDRHGRDHRIVRPRCGLSSCSAERGRDLTERPRSGRIERKRVEVCFGLLQVGLPRCTLCLGTDGEGNTRLQVCLTRDTLRL